MTRYLILAALLALSSQADAQRRGGNVSGYDPLAPRHGFNVVTDLPQQWRGWGNSGKRGLGGDPTPCCAEDPGQQPRK